MVSISTLWLLSTWNVDLNFLLFNFNALKFKVNYMCIGEFSSRVGLGSKIGSYFFKPSIVNWNTDIQHHTKQMPGLMSDHKANFPVTTS